MLRSISLISALLLSGVFPAFAGTIYIDTGGSATNSGSTDANSATTTGATSTDATTVVTLSGSPDLSGVITTPGATQSSIYLTAATVANRKIYWITAVDDTLDTVTVDTAPACTAGACGAWAIGGRVILTSASQEGSLRAGDVAIFNNSPASAAATIWNFRVAGDAASGPAKIMGKSGTRPVLTSTSTTLPVINVNSFYNVWVENLELSQSGASGTTSAVTANGALSMFNNIKISAARGNGITGTGAQLRVWNSEITAVLLDGINYATGVRSQITGNYIHDVGGDCIEYTGTTPTEVASFNVLDTCGARGILFSGAVSTGATNVLNDVKSNTIYGAANSGLEVTDADNVVLFENNLFIQNGDAADEYNVEWAAGAAEYVGGHGYNDFYHSNCQGSGTGGPGCIFGATANATELTADPLFTNASGGDFSLGAASPAKATAYPGVFVGGSTGYLDMGAVQMQSSGSGGYIIGG